MKEFKQNIVDAIVAKAQDLRIISLYEVCREMGINHLHTQSCIHIITAVEKALPDYRLVQFLTQKQMRRPETASLFTTINFVERCLEFEDTEQ